MRRVELIFFLMFAVSRLCAEDSDDFAKNVAPIFAKHCVSCHGAVDPEGGLILDRHAALMKGGEDGAVIVPGKSDQSVLVRLVESKTKNVMPPGKRKKLDASEIAAVRAWIDTGAKAPKVDNPIASSAELVTPDIKPKAPPRRPIYAVASTPDGKLIAVARHGEVQLRNADSLALVKTLSGHKGSVNAVAFSNDGKTLASAAGETGVYGEAKFWNVADGALIKTFKGHQDSLYSIAISPDGGTLATGSYDQKIILWNIVSGEQICTLFGHNACVFALSFRKDGKVLASASGDRTVKLWDTANGNRLDTLSTPLKEMYTVAFRPDGKRLAAGGADSRIRVWQISDTAVDGTNTVLSAVFAHEGAILRLNYSADGKQLLTCGEDRAIKLWDAENVTQKQTFPQQPDWATGVVFGTENKTVIAGRIDGSIGIYDAATGKLAKPEITAIEPRGIQRGVPAKIKISGKNLVDISQIKFNNPKLHADFAMNDARIDETLLLIKSEPDLPRGSYEISFANAAGESAKMSLHADDIPQMQEDAAAVALPAAFWGTFDKQGDADEFTFQARAGETIVIDTAAKSIGSKASVKLELLGGGRRAPVSVGAMDESSEPLLAYKILVDGEYKLRVAERTLAASKEHFYRINVGAFPFVTGFFPMGVPANSESDVRLIGFNLPRESSVRVKAGMAGEIALPIDANQFRSRKMLKALVSDIRETVEREPNNSVEQATQLEAPAAAEGTIDSASDADYFSFQSKAGQKWIVETTAAQRGSPVDSKLELLTAGGKPIPRVQLQAMRDSYVNFRTVDSSGTGIRFHNYEEMELNEFIYMQGEVGRLFRMPQGPDSDMILYRSVAGPRRCYFDTSGASQANEETVYIVEPHPPGAKLEPNGLPVFTLNYVNDDDGERRLGTDSRVYFTAPADGTCFARVSDTRGFGGERFVYRLVVREPRPDFNVSLQGENPTVNAASGKSFTFVADRTDGFEGEIHIDIAGAPPGFLISTPLVIEAGHRETQGTVYDARPSAEDGRKEITPAFKITATAVIDGKTVTKDVKSLGKITVADKPKLLVTLDPYTAPSEAAAIPEITIAPGTTIPAWLRVKRNGHEDLITFSVDNLPHGVIVDNIGLSGVLMEKGLSERQIFLTAAKWVGEMDRLCFAVENQAGKQTSRPVMLKVRRPH